MWDGEQGERAKKIRVLDLPRPPVLSGRKMDGSKKSRISAGRLIGRMMACPAPVLRRPSPKSPPSPPIPFLFLFPRAQPMQSKPASDAGFSSVIIISSNWRRSWLDLRGTRDEQTIYRNTLPALVRTIPYENIESLASQQVINLVVGPRADQETEADIVSAP